MHSMRAAADGAWKYNELAAAAYYRPARPSLAALAAALAAAAVEYWLLLGPQMSD